MTPEHSFDPGATVVPLLATLFFVVLNGFFVAAEFALVKVRASRLDALVEEGRGSARVAREILAHLGRYLSACQLGITLASLILGWLAEPAFAALLLGGLEAAGVHVDPSNRLLHGAALVVALTVVTGLHMVFGEQAPKIWAIQRAEATTLLVARPLKIFTAALRPLIWAIDEASSLLLRLAGLPPGDFHASDHDVAELRAIVAAAAQAGHISTRQSTLAQNVFGIIGLETRHILVPRVDVEALSLQRPDQENLEVLKQARHSRYPLCENDLDSVVGVIHVRDVVRSLSDPEATTDLRAMARPALYVPESQPLSKLIVTMQNERNHVAVVVDEHGTSMGLAFLEDALEEIVGPLRDEFDDDDAGAVQKRDDGSLRLPGRLALPKAVALLGLPSADLEDAETIGGLVTGRLGRLPARGDEVQLGGFKVTVEAVARRRISWLQARPLKRDEGA